MPEKLFKLTMNKKRNTNKLTVREIVKLTLLILIYLQQRSLCRTNRLILLRKEPEGKSKHILQTTRDQRTNK